MFTWSQARICSGPLRYWNFRPSRARVTLSVSSDFTSRAVSSSTRTVEYVDAV